MHRRAEGPEVRIAPPISKTEDRIHGASEPESMHSHCFVKMICLQFQLLLKKVVHGSFKKLG